MQISSNLKTVPGGTKLAKQFAFSFSRLDQFETCPKKYYEVNVAKNYGESNIDQLNWGKEVHTALSAACLGTAELPEHMVSYQHWVNEVRRWPRAGTLLAEQQLAITKDFRPTKWFADDVWFRCVVDLLYMLPPIAISWDWKTGKIKENSIQLMTSAQVVMIHYPEIKRVRTEYVWLKDDVRTHPEFFNKRDIASQWLSVIDRAKNLEQAAKNMEYPPRPNRLCREWCPVTSCPFHGKAQT